MKVGLFTAGLVLALQGAFASPKVPLDEAIAKVRAKYAVSEKRETLKAKQKVEREALKAHQKGERDALKTVK